MDIRKHKLTVVKMEAEEIFKAAGEEAIAIRWVRITCENGTGDAQLGFLKNSDEAKQIHIGDVIEVEQKHT